MFNFYTLIFQNKIKYQADLLKLNRQYGCDPNDNCWDDDVRFCPELVANGTCVTDPQQMIIRCKKSCGFCRYPDCYDVADNCHTWALQGLCEEDPDFMLANGCNRSCLTCLPQQGKHVKISNTKLKQ